ncbi:tripartite tricarboxylate transporter substrate-binding protein [Actibacterium sp. MT2.3-13A]|uniref:Bug family tripartite tricarboxylate transporter substrate binding protein n=1 Tax=Actibacterium sp. MT2.3-13A TaxID=2828332 RepID=UPI001BAB3BEB|nr:tripartite tricarboxylate transporter substrate-binding protein [Actibacterium sp. MT2.3-13A]
MKKFMVAAVLLASSITPGWADGYFKGKTITYIIATNPGGNYDAYGRLIGRHLEGKLGAKSVVFKNIPGAGHIVGANTLHSSKPDGLTIGTFNTGLIYSQLLQTEGLNFDLGEMSWIGKAASDMRSVVLSSNSGLKSFEDLLNSEKKVLFAGAGIGSASFTETMMLRDGLDLNIEMIPGYNGNEGEMAMLRGEVAGQVSSYDSLRPFVEAGNGFFALLVGGDKQPQAIDYAKTEKGKAIVSLIDATSNLGRLTAAPPGVPADVLEELRDGYMAVLEDPAFLAEAEKLGLSIQGVRGDKVAEMIQAALQQSPETLKIISAAMNVEVPTLKVRSDILSLEDSNKIIEFNAGDQKVKAKISGSRTKVTVGGAEADRKQLVVGMNCAIEFDPNHEENEPSVIACNS